METGLTTAEAEKRLKKQGYNELPQGKESFWDRVKETFSEPMIILLLVGSTLYFFLGEISDAIPLLLSVVAIIAIDIYEENKAEKALESLRQIGSPKAYALRNGETIQIPIREIVIGDVLVLSEGDRVPADAKLLQVTGINCDESMLTGESVPIPKLEKSLVYMGTLVTAGHGLAKVTATRTKTEMGKIGKSLEEIVVTPSPSKVETEKVVKFFAAIGLTLCASLLLYYGILKSNWLQGLLAGITLAMSVIPEEIPVVLAVFTILGAFRMSKKRVLAKRSSVIETLGAATVICLDKTGTITQNKMVVSQFFSHGKTWTSCKKPIPEDFNELIKYAILANRKRTVDPLEKAIIDVGEAVWGSRHLFEDWRHVKEIPISEKVIALTEVWADASGQTITAVKGAPESVMELCGVNPFEKELLESQITAMAANGLRVMAVARDHEFLGLLGLSDPIRPAIKDAVKTCYSAGIRIIIITGDHPETAKRVAAEIGLKQSSQYLLGNALKELDEPGIIRAVKTNNIFARVSPSQKLLLVEALKKSGEVVTMIGDGVNDAPAIKAAHIGVAMGEHGTDVARESASLVLLDDNFTSVVEAVRLGRRIYSNIQKAITYIIAMHFPVAGMALIPVFLGFPPVLFPIHIAIMELFTDPASSIVFESQPEEPGVMTRTPRPLTARIINRGLLILGSLQGVIALGTALVAFWLANLWKLDSAQVRTFCLVTLLTINVGVVLVNRTTNKAGVLWRADPRLFVFLIVSAIFVILTPHLPLVRDFLKLSYLGFHLQAAAVLIGTIATTALFLVRKALTVRSIHYTSNFG